MSLSSFEAILGDQSGQNASSAIGLPDDPIYGLPPAGMETTTAADAPPPSLFGGVWNTIADDSRGALNYVEAAPGKALATAETGIETAYATVKGGVSTVIGDVTNPLGGVLKTTYWYIIGAVVVLGAVLYFTGKSGGLRVSV